MKYDLKCINLCKWIGCENDSTKEHSQEKLEYSSSDGDKEESYFSKR